MVFERTVYPSGVPRSTCRQEKLSESLFACPSEPVGSVRPKIPSTDDIRGFRTVQNGSQALICPAQGFPVPLNR